MELKTWVKLEAGRSARLAEHLTSVVSKVTPDRRIDRAQVTGWTSAPGTPGHRPIPTDLAPEIEAFTSGEVPRWDTCPKNWFLLWPELRTHRDAPLIPELEAKADA